MTGIARRRLASGLLALLALGAVSAPGGLALRLLERPLPDIAVDGDHALIALATAQAADGRRLLGPYSRLGFHHPGPVLFYLYAPFYAGSGGRYLALCLAVLLLVTVSTVTVLAALGREPEPRRMGAVALVLGLFFLYLEPGVLVSPWNPHALMLPLLAALVALAAVAAGGPVWLPAAVVFASIALQAHLATAAPLAAAAAVAAWIRVRAPRNGGSRGAMSAGAAAALVIWMPVVLEAVLFRGGNLGAILRYLTAPRTGTSVVDAASIVLGRISGPLLVPWGVSARQAAAGALADLAPWLAVALLCTAVAAAALARGSSRCLAAALSATAVIGTLAAIAEVVAAGEHGDPHVLRWIGLLGVLALLAVAVSLPPGRGAFGAVEAVLAGALLLVTAASWTAVLRWDDVAALAQSEAVGRNLELGEAAAAACRAAGAGQATLALERADDWGVAAAVAARLDLHRLGFAIDRRWAGLFDTGASPPVEGLRLALVRSAVGEELASRSGLRLVRLRVPVPPPSGLLLNDPIALGLVLDGFSEPEGTAEDGFRWSVGDASRLLLRLPDSTADGVLALELRPLVQGDRVQRLTVSASALPAGEVTLDPTGFRWYRFRIPHGAAGRVVEVEVRYDWTVRPSDHSHSADTRELAVQWRRLGLEPVAQPPSERHGTPAAASAATRSSAATPEITSTLSREPAPARISTCPGDSPSTASRRSVTARLARPRSGAACTSSLRAPPCAPSRRVRLAPGLTRSRIENPSPRRVTVTASSTCPISPVTGSPRAWRSR